MGGITKLITNLVTLVTFLLLVGLVYYGLSGGGQNNPLSAFGNLTPTTLNGNPNLTTVSTQQNVSQTSAALDTYALNLINTDRQKYGLTNVTLSNESSGQQHSDSMLTHGYFSHWDTYGMKPYMRYTLLGGTGAVSENVAYKFSSHCSILGCSGDVNVKQALQSAEYNMMYNDSACCNNGHRDNILTPDHNQVSIGIAYNSSTVYFTEDFIDNYITWSSYGLSVPDDEMYVAGTAQPGYTLEDALITYDPAVASMTRAQLDNTSSYGYGKEIAGVAKNSLYYYNGISTIVADHYTSNGGNFNVAFNMKDTIRSNGAGEYTVLVWLNGTRGNFIASTYTIFVGGDGQVYQPQNV